ncbi:hypothetical protein, partial [Microcoleus anatoxicus]|uniref:hypothetical protein n=1 Tax=Microcoleus anatoxicus TaxID=2705319 RepID=UPI0030C9F0FD
ANWGWVLADVGGQMVVLNTEGIQVGSFSGPPLPKAIAPWGNKGLVIATNTDEGSHLHFLDIGV